MTVDVSPVPPPELSDDAVALWTSVVDVYELEDHETALLREACRTVTTCDRLDAVIAADGFMAKGSTGQPVVHPAVLELRQQRLALGRLIAQLRLPEGESEGRPQRRGGARGLYAVGS